MASSKRERELARMRAQRQAARRAQAAAERAKRRNAILMGLAALAVAGVIVVIALVTSGGKTKATVAQQPTPSPSHSGCVYTPAGKASKAVTGLPSTTGPVVKGDSHVKLTTNRGLLGLTLHGAQAPCTVNSFEFLANQHYFDNTKCHRLTTSGIYVLQCGDPSATGSGGPGYSFGDENLTALGTGSSVVYPRGTVAMANSGPSTNGSQFFLVYKNSPLPPNYTPFGTISQGLSLLDAVAKGGSTPPSDGKPNLPVTILKATVA